ncbi:MAG: hypothetical protein ACPGJS_24115, partial [Flammeovirgaceae bacterium]
STLPFPTSFPMISIEEGDNFSIQVGEDLIIHIRIESETIMESMEVYKNGSLFQNINLEHSFNLRHQYIFQGIKADAGQIHTLTFVVIDDEGVGSAKSITVEVKETPLTFTFQNAQITNANGAGNFAWDLAANGGSTTTNKMDIVNTSNATDGWVTGWTSNTLTRFVKLSGAPSIALDDLIMEDLIALYNIGTPVSTLAVETGDWIIAKIRESGEYAIIHIDHVDETIDNATEGIRFTYKKSAESVGD